MDSPVTVYASKGKLFDTALTYLLEKDFVINKKDRNAGTIETKYKESTSLFSKSRRSKLTINITQLTNSTSKFYLQPRVEEKANNNSWKLVEDIGSMNRRGLANIVNEIKENAEGFLASRYNQGSRSSGKISFKSHTWPVTLIAAALAYDYLTDAKNIGDQMDDFQKHFGNDYPGKSGLQKMKDRKQMLGIVFILAGALNLYVGAERVKIIPARKQFGLGVNIKL